jgi:hypothetical protein
MTKDLLGVDVGGVLIDRIRADGSDTSFFSNRFLETPPVEGAFDVLERLAAKRFGQNICIVSKCGPRTEEKTRLWLSAHRLLGRLGLTEANLHFCRERRDKGPICKRLGVTHFIDDRLDVLEYLTTVRHRFLFGPQEHEPSSSAGVICVKTWAEAADALLGGTSLPG